MPPEILTFPAGLRQAATFDESLIARAARGGIVASVWEAQQGLVVPRTYPRHDGFAAACDASASQSWPVSIRLSGGGIVPQGPGIINVSLAYAVDGAPLDHSDQAYLLICGVIQRALGEHGIATHAAAVDGAFCDGRYNLAHGEAPTAKKVAGTAQLWRRIRPDGVSSAPATVQIVLVHALILAAVDVPSITDRANRFEQAIRHDKQYDPARMASLHECQSDPMLPADAFTAALTVSLLTQLRRM